MTLTITTISLVALVLGFWYLYSRNSSTNTTGSIDVDLDIKLDGSDQTTQEDSTSVSIGFSGTTEEPENKQPILKETVTEGKKPAKAKVQKKAPSKRGRKPKKDKGNDLLLS